MTHLHRWRGWVCAALLLLLGALVVHALHTVVAQISVGQVIEAVRATPGPALWLSVAVTTMAYVALTFYDRTALAYAGVTLGLLHGSQPDFLVLCHDPSRKTIEYRPDFPIPPLADACARYTMK